ncbi:MAG: porin, partial [Deltaproteobacteria bacterium]|nr:porin [Deltaproteobacteria bacterium]
MKRLMLSVGILAILLTCQAGSAKTLEEVLKEKGVITEDDFKEVAASKPVAYQPGKGFTFTSSDRKFQLSLGGRGQFQYQYVDKDDVNGPAQETSVWKIRRFKVSMGGYAFTQDLTYRVQVDLTKSGTAQMLDDAWIN